MTLVATQVKRRRGTTAENDAFTGAEGEITVDLGNKELRVHTGDSKQGGYGTARKDFENITDDAKNISNWSSNVSNCITNIPQDIKLELNNGALTLKAGSKIYVPNGAGVFNVVNTTNDFNISYGSAIPNLILCLNTSGIGFSLTVASECYSGSTEPSPSSSYRQIWYDTTNNIVKTRGASSTEWAQQLSLPIAILNCTGTNKFTINKVFNGFGYIGSTVFALPGVKGLIPDGRNADGTLRNTEFETSGVLTYSRRSKYSNYYIVLQGNEIANTSCTYDERNNYTLNSSGNPINFAIVGKISSSDNDGTISNFLVKTAFRAVDYNEADFVVSSQEPTGSNNYTWYRKYANGWVEQGCLSCFLPAQGADTEAGATFTFPIAMLSSAYDVNCALMTDGGFIYELTQTRVLRNNNNCSVRFFSTVVTSGQSQVTVTVRGMAAN